MSEVVTLWMRGDLDAFLQPRTWSDAGREVMKATDWAHGSGSMEMHTRRDLVGLPDEIGHFLLQPAYRISFETGVVDKVVLGFPSVQLSPTRKGRQTTNSWNIFQ